jgi:hypothetical protein
MSVDTLLQEEAPVMLRLYKLPSGSGRYVFGSLLGADGKPKYPDLNGRTISFVMGRYATKDPREIEELDQQVQLGATDIVIDAREREIDQRASDPMFRLKEQLRKQILAEMAAASNPNNDRGNYEPGKLNPTSTQTIAATAAGGSGEASSAMARVHAMLGKS